MVEYKTMRVPSDAWEDAHDAKEDGESWGEYLRRCAEAESVSTVGELDVDELVARLRSELDGRSDGDGDVPGEIEDLINRIDDLETEVKSELEDLQRP